MTWREECNPEGYPHRGHPLRRGAPDACQIHKWQDDGGWCYRCDLPFESDECKCAEDEEALLAVLGNGPWPVGLQVRDIPGIRLEAVARSLVRGGKVVVRQDAATGEDLWVLAEAA